MATMCQVGIFETDNGYYVQRDIKHSITTEIAQDKCLLNGTMTDAKTELEQSSRWLSLMACRPAPMS